ncbi:MULTISPECIES: N-acetylmuramoyl-L-alanine amidase [Streptomyces]|uniref:N-acetylmuramoyl-L-alanine amidase n=1 Tax=Streptomyces glycanivorans TaxID=3033808 RepID=A0ABY9JE30_9ACTN|nr:MULTISPECIES: N-acetylmuramoyl-L-alanine amidase [unclassified Streptomyces]WSQ79476.1 N-acetylmuramoyl-L-alanine amidase [Streptomyces sp. NBC_01213]WLQ66036.1 N-acetylmuramoyl-L-alanine amidase [Streptomyces sp. Alt3]WSQ86857.1 N-acetylmuramoyl-L-alanine amidase [Streptomyces sp. NBC_01212]WSR07126.1 N-acetylmuramoyl-L-alanine amidase [Streptomyces sp. NBC_01208]WSR50132.1 N-acetylmuramoyl-L-alanine amidase [Streptomyces sp. NBC_01201]
MRALLATSIGVTCATALTLPLAAPAPAAPAPARAPVAQAPAASPGEPAGSTQSLPLRPLTDALPRATGKPTESMHPDAAQGLQRRDSHRFSLVGVVWDDADAELHGTVQVRTRATGTTQWSGWQSLETHNTDHAADAGSPERESGKVRGSTAPLWVGDSDGVEVRVRSENAGPRTGPVDTAPLPAGLQVELVDPGDDPEQPRAEATPATGAPSAVTPSAGVATPATAVAQPGALPDSAGLTAAAAESSAVNADLAPLGATEIPALSKAESEEQAVVAAGAKPFVGPRPGIVTRKGWGADESLRERAFAYTSTVKAAFIHHSATGNNYTCAQAPSVLRSIYRYHVKSSGWRDFGYNFAVDKCGNIYEGRAGGVTKAVLGAHTLGFNTNSMGIAVLGTYTSKNPPAAAVTAIAKLTAWKLGLFGRNPKGKVTLVSGGSGKYKKGAKAKLNVISGHRDGFATECPGIRLYKKLGTARTSSAKLQGR